MLIIDTPGISSIEETHDIITFGYLTMVDVAFVVMNINVGAPTKSLIDFLRQIPKDFMTKMYFVLNFADTMNPAKHDKMLVSFTKDLSEVINKPKVFLLSALTALNARTDKSTESSELGSLSMIERIMKEEVPKLKSTVENKRMEALIRKEANSLKELLYLKLDTLTWDTPEIDKRIGKLSKEIGKVDCDISGFKRQFREIKELSITQVSSVIDNYIENISALVIKEKPIDGLVNSMVEEIKTVLETNFARIKSIELASLECDVSGVIQTAIENETSHIKGVADLITDIATFLLTFWLVPGGTAVAAAGEAVAATGVTAIQTAARKLGKVAEKVAKIAEAVINDADEDVKKGGFLKVMGKIGRVVKELNPLEKVKDLALPFIMNPKLAKSLRPKITSRLYLVFTEIETAINQEIKNNYLKPMKQKEELLVQQREERDQVRKKVDETRESIESDIASFDDRRKVYEQ